MPLFQNELAGTGLGISVFPSGTSMLFAQTAAPTGWTKSTSHDNKALRVVSGTASSGGSTAFTSVFTSRTPAGTVSGTVSGTNSGGAVGSTTLTAAQSGLRDHSHGITDPGHRHQLRGDQDAPDGGASLGTDDNFTYAFPFANSMDLATTGITINGSGALNASEGHTHSFTNPSWSGSMSASFSGTAMDFAVQYVDVIIATKD
jgi:hypothetical protein